jgi:2'-5' RNA ligase
MSDGELRTFFALSLPSELATLCAELEHELAPGARRQQAPVRFLGAAQLHLTLCFLGSTPREQVQPLTAAARELAGLSRPIELTRGSLTAFPSRQQARVVVLELADAQHQIARLAEALASRALQLGFEGEDRRFRPHVTLARMREPKSVTAWLPEREVTTMGSFSELVYFASERRPSGAEYTALARFPLRG